MASSNRAPSSANRRQPSTLSSFDLWKRLNPGYVNVAASSTTRSEYSWNPEEIDPLNKQHFAKRDAVTEYVEAVAKVHNLKKSALQKNSAAPAAPSPT
eukprot:TRINITY_DN6295_c0_g1_i4.p1 TRINITY_DN6295_c0_g1~~TRINITY_DN6295_c0_g1_i4.p1  ORF type:complete len:114 (-),score=21.13 TRINITY_DN6295_c0_g1_i4:257-550(-)